MNDATALIAEDEAPLRQFLRKRLAEVWPQLRICAEAKDGGEALELIERHRPHIAFLDIRMPGLTGMEVAERIADISRIVFVTAYDEYAVEAFEKEAVDYLVKPISRQRLEITVRRLKNQLESGATIPLDTMERLMKRLSGEEKPRHLQYIRVLQGDAIRLIPVDDVIYFKAQDKYTAVLTRDTEFLIRKSIKELAEALNPDTFLQIHRGTIVHIRSIARVSRSLTGKGALKLKDRSETLAVSNRYMHLFKQM